MKKQLDLIINIVKKILKRSITEPIQTKKKVTVISNVHKDLYLNFQDNGDEILITIYPNKQYINSELVSENKGLSVEFGPIYY